MLKCRDVALKGTDYLEKRLSCIQQYKLGMHLLMCKHCRLFFRQLSFTTNVVSFYRFRVTSETEVDVIINTVVLRISNQASV